jgi:GTP pyrophosphokinase
MKDKKLDFLLNQIRKYNPQADFELIEKAYNFATEIHHGQKRLSGDLYIEHPIAVAQALVDWKLDSGSIAAGLLHDVIEDGKVKIEKIRKEFSQEIAVLVSGVTKIGEIKLHGSREEKFVENLRKMIVVMAHDLRVVLIKLADRYHNMQTLSSLPPKKQKRIARETLEVYALLAERLGIGEMKGKLEDLAFPYVYPEEYQWVKKYSVAYFKKTNQFVEKIKREVLKELVGKEIKARVHGRAKHLYSLYQKLCRPEVDKDITKIHDLIALRIIVNTIEQCYGALGVIHKLYKPAPTEGISDFIAQPKPNGYRSIHTKVFAHGRIIEIQIRTKEMHEQAENGIAAHWFYSQKKSNGLSSWRLAVGLFAPTEKMSWVKELVKWQKEITDSKEFINSLKFDALGHRNFVFSPNGDVFDLPRGATPVDMAYAIHTEVGNQCCGAKVDGKMMPLDYKLKSGQVVEIFKSKQKKKPSRDWLGFVVTRYAKNQIAKQFRKS